MEASCLWRCKHGLYVRLGFSRRRMVTLMVIVAVDTGHTALCPVSQHIIHVCDVVGSHIVGSHTRFVSLYPFGRVSYRYALSASAATNRSATKGCVTGTTVSTSFCDSVMSFFSKSSNFWLSIGSDTTSPVRPPYTIALANSTPLIPSGACDINSTVGSRIASKKFDKIASVSSAADAAGPESTKVSATRRASKRLSLSQLRVYVGGSSRISAAPTGTNMISGGPTSPSPRRAASDSILFLVKTSVSWAV